MSQSEEEENFAHQVQNFWVPWEYQQPLPGGGEEAIPDPVENIVGLNSLFGHPNLMDPLHAVGGSSLASGEEQPLNITTSEAGEVVIDAGANAGSTSMTEQTPLVLNIVVDIREEENLEPGAMVVISLYVESPHKAANDVEEANPQLMADDIDNTVLVSDENNDCSVLVAWNSQCISNEEVLQEFEELELNKSSIWESTEPTSSHHLDINDVKFTAWCETCEKHLFCSCDQRPIFQDVEVTEFTMERLPDTSDEADPRFSFKFSIKLYYYDPKVFVWTISDVRTEEKWTVESSQENVASFRHKFRGHSVICFRRQTEVDGNREQAPSRMQTALPPCQVNTFYDRS
ncbi:hypothetical protein O6H91_11G069200 [Diphasiastrum complanatum]|uniref:Uncharacterized protein n=1 Tax=Diphasiastrum complanatum TaxID=34168 RepID=A0ACC2CBB5_DIPCM|nr:hypothetical protein O6H91_11G069200 [Diphasiastrum complanatum]